MRIYVQEVYKKYKQKTNQDHGEQRTGIHMKTTTDKGTSKHKGCLYTGGNKANKTHLETISDLINIKNYKRTKKLAQQTGTQPST